MQPREIVKLAARASRLSSVKRWMLADEKGVFERHAADLWRDGLHNHPAADHGKLAQEIAVLLRFEATTAMLQRAESK